MVNYYVSFLLSASIFFKSYFKLLNLYSVFFFMMPSDTHHRKPWFGDHSSLERGNRPLASRRCQIPSCNLIASFPMRSYVYRSGAAVAEWLSSWLAEQEDRGSNPGLATWIFRDWLSPASKSRYGWKIAKSTLILKTTNQPTNVFRSFWLWYRLNYFMKSSESF